MTKKKILFIPSDLTGCGTMRLIQPIREIQRRGDLGDIEFHLYTDLFGEESNKNNLLINLLKFDGLLFQRVVSPQLLDIAKTLKSRGKKVWLDLDDALHDLSSSNPAYSVWHKGSDASYVLRDFCKTADALILSTPELQEIYKNDNPNSVVFLNAIDSSLPIYKEENRQRHKIAADKIVIQWLGSSSHADSLKQITKPIKKLFKQRDDILFAFCSNRQYLDFFDIPEDKKIYIKPRNINDYPSAMSFGDINLATIVPSRFNSGKSELKVLEAAIWKIPSCCSYVEPYTRFNKVSGGGNFLIYQNDSGEWVNKINKLIDDKELRNNMGQISYAATVDHYSLSRINDGRIKWFREQFN